MLWLTLGGLLLLTIGGVIIKVLPKMTILGIVLALIGAFFAISMFILVQKDDARHAAQCASIDGSYGGDTCYVSGVEQDLKEIGL